MKKALLGVVWSFLLITLALSMGFLLKPMTSVQLEAQTTSSCSSVLEAYDFEQITVSTALVSFSTTKINPAGQPSAKAVMFTVEANVIRYQFGPGATPTTSIGHTAGIVGTENITYCIANINNIRNFRAVRQSADAKINATYLR